MALIYCGCKTADQTNGNLSCPDGHVEKYTGCVLETFERNGYDDSDFCAIVWDGTTLREETYASTRGWTYHNGAKVDATEEVRAAALAWYREKLGPVLIDNARMQAEEVKVGRTVRSLTTRGKAKGVVGDVFWLGVDNYRTTRHHTYYRAGIRTDGGEKVFVAAERLEVTEPEPVNDAEWLAVAAKAKPANWRSARYQVTGAM